MIVDAIIPALDEEATIAGVIGEFRAHCRRVVVVDNGCRDRTAERARDAGAIVVAEARRGYGAACLAGIATLEALGPPDVVLFLDGDGADDPADLPRLLEPLREARAELVLGSRTLPESRNEPGALLPQQRVGNLVATTLIRLLYGARQTDLGPYRAIRWAALRSLDMSDPTYGWTVEMQCKALRSGVRTVEVASRWRRRRGGESKVSGTVWGTIGAGWKILWTVARYSLVT